MKTLICAVSRSLLAFTLMLSANVLATGPAISWEDVHNGDLVIMRHALAPGTGDPGSFSLRDCTTQRNLSDTGREQAQGIGEKIKQAGIENTKVYSSQWCRCLDTATELNVGTTTEQPFLNSFFGRRELEAPQMTSLRNWIPSLNTDTVTILVTHQVVVTSLTGVYPASGDAVVFNLNENDEIKIKGIISAE